MNRAAKLPCLPFITMKSVPPLQLQLRPSRMASVATLALYLMALPMPWLANLSAWLAACLSGAILLALLLAARHWRQSQGSRLKLLADGNWLLEEGGLATEYALGEGVYCTLGLVVLPLRAEDGRKRRLLLWPDSTAPDALRRLRVWLRWGLERPTSRQAAP